METHLLAPQGEFELLRKPHHPKDNLRAWDAADEYSLKEIAAEPINADCHMLILNDSFGALSVSLHPFKPVLISDSYLAQAATIENLTRNKLDPDSVTIRHSLYVPQKVVDCLIIKVPKTLALLEFQLIQLRPWLSDNTRIMVAGMVKTMPKSVWEMLERIVGQTTTQLAWKKSRIIRVQVNSELDMPNNPYPVSYRLENTDYQLINHANVFSRDKLDIGARFFLQHLPVNRQARSIIDLGCGNGVLGLLMAKEHPQAEIIFIDESYMAVCSASENFKHAFPGRDQARFIHQDSLSGQAENSADIIVCNPPFHQQHAVGDHIARRMFQQALKVLKKGGELRIIGNPHLNYHILLKRYFGNCQTVASNKKFVVLQAINSVLP